MQANIILRKNPISKVTFGIVPSVILNHGGCETEGCWEAHPNVSEIKTDETLKNLTQLAASFHHSERLQD